MGPKLHFRHMLINYFTEIEKKQFGYKMFNRFTEPGHPRTGGEGQSCY